jgi:hypothetical protein
MVSCTRVELQALVDSVSAYPRWLIIAAATLVAVLLIWVVAKLLEWALWLLLIAVIVGGLAWAIWAVLK